ncbi:MAG: hypothetical protein NTU88_10885, partial [Armatimonadetes bacterium]|nr:hypothetical protein [Armatimonadota bacterium]
MGLVHAQIGRVVNGIEQLCDQSIEVELPAFSLHRQEQTRPEIGEYSHARPARAERPDRLQKDSSVNALIAGLDIPAEDVQTPSRQLGRAFLRIGRHVSHAVPELTVAESGPYSIQRRIQAGDSLHRPKLVGREPSPFLGLPVRRYLDALCRLEQEREDEPLPTGAVVIHGHGDSHALKLDLIFLDLRLFPQLE